MNIKRFNEELDNDDHRRQIKVTVQDIIEYLKTLPPDATSSLDHDGWEYDGGGENGFEIVKNSTLFWYDKKRNHLYINN